MLVILIIGLMAGPKAGAVTAIGVPQSAQYLLTLHDFLRRAARRLSIHRQGTGRLRVVAGGPSMRIRFEDETRELAVAVSISHTPVMATAIVVELPLSNT